MKKMFQVYGSGSWSFCPRRSGWTSREGPRRTRTIVLDHNVFSRKNILFTGTNAAGPRRKMRPLSPGQVLGIWRQLVEAVAAVHACGVIHFDIKPGNILVMDEQGRDHACLTHDDDPVPLLKLADFGLARKLMEDESHISADGGWGTLKYMAPEVVHQPSHAFQFRPGIDVWSLGIILHQLLHEGKTPYDFLLNQTKLANAGIKLRLALGIADPRALQGGAGQFIRDDWIFGGGGGQSSQGVLLREFLLATQNACLAFLHDDRAEAQTLKLQVEELVVALKELRARESRNDSSEDHGGTTGGPVAIPPEPVQEVLETVEAVQQPFLRTEDGPNRPKKERPKRLLSEVLRDRPALAELLRRRWEVEDGQETTTSWCGKRVGSGRLIWAAALIVLLVSGGVAFFLVSRLRADGQEVVNTAEMSTSSVSVSSTSGKDRVGIFSFSLSCTVTSEVFLRCWRKFAAC